MSASVVICLCQEVSTLLLGAVLLYYHYWVGRLTRLGAPIRSLTQNPKAQPRQARFADSAARRLSASSSPPAPGMSASSSPPAPGIGRAAQRSASLSPTPGKRGMGRQLSAPSALARFRPFSSAPGPDGAQALVRTTANPNRN